MPQLPSVGELIAPIIGNVPEEQRPLLVALAEKIAAGRYRDWAEQASGSDRHALLACADREEQRKVFFDNAELEEASAAVLEALVAAD